MRNISAVCLYTLFATCVAVIPTIALPRATAQVSTPNPYQVEKKKGPPIPSDINPWKKEPPRITAVAPLDPDGVTPVAVVGETTLEIFGENFSPMPALNPIVVTLYSETDAQGSRPDSAAEIIEWVPQSAEATRLTVFVGNDFPGDTGKYLIWVLGNGWSNPVEVQFEKHYAEVFNPAMKLLATQAITFGPAATGDLKGPNLIHYQRDTAFNSIEMHPDGTIYVAYTPATSPTWYETYDANEAAGHKEDWIRAGSSGVGKFFDLKWHNVDEPNWLPWHQAFPPGRMPAPRWLKISLPPGKQPEEWLQAYLELGDKLVRGTAPILIKDPGAYCFHSAHMVEGSVEYKNTPWLGGPPEWNTILPINTNGENGQKKYDPLRPAVASGNHYISWSELLNLVYDDAPRAEMILQWRGHPNEDDTMDRRIPWISSFLSGLVTNSFLSGSDYGGSHRAPARNYWLGGPPPKFAYRENWFPDDAGALTEITNDLGNDWIVYVKPDPPYRFMLVGDALKLGAKNRGNLDDELRGTIENEIEQWLVPVGFRPEPGDRIFMSGRWIIDCGHDDWHAELHPFESYVSTHRESREEALGGTEAVSTVVVTGAWPGGVVEFDLWPPSRPSHEAALTWAHDTPIATELLVEHELQPQENPNHLHFRVRSTAPWAPLLTKDLNDVYYNVTRRLVARYRLWWVAR